MKLYFRDANLNRRLIAENISEHAEVFKKINEFLESRNYTAPYIRTWGDDGEMWFDVGSHTEFFVLSME